MARAALVVAAPVRVVTDDDVRDILRVRVAEAGTQRAYSLSSGVHEATVSTVLNGGRPTKALLAALGVRPALIIERDAR